MAQEFGGPHPAQVVLTAGNPESTYVCPSKPFAGTGRQGRIHFFRVGPARPGRPAGLERRPARWLGWLGILAGVLMFLHLEPGRRGFAPHRRRGPICYGCYCWQAGCSSGERERQTAGDIDGEKGEH